MNYDPDYPYDDVFLEVCVRNFDSGARLNHRLERSQARLELARLAKAWLDSGDWRRWPGGFHSDDPYYSLHLVRQGVNTSPEFVARAPEREAFDAAQQPLS